jgi:restriction system protein
MSRSKEIAAKVIEAAFKILKDSGGSLRASELMNKIEKSIPLDSYELEKFESNGNARWTSILHFYSIGCIKAGYITKHKGVWTLTSEGEILIPKGGTQILDSVDKSYKAWKQQRDSETENMVGHSQESDIPIHYEIQAKNDELESKALDGIIGYIRKKNPYEFQDLVAALLRGMGYFTPYVAPRGKDGGIDIVAYRDPIGATVPRIKVQVKHKPDSAIPVSEIHQLLGKLRDGGEIGMIITSGRFTSDSVFAARDSRTHIELIDINRFVEMWQSFYMKLTDEDKNMLPLYPIYFLGSNE